MKDLALIISLYILLGWATLILQNPNIFLARYPVHATKPAMQDKPYNVFMFDNYDKLAAMRINEGQEKEAINILVKGLNDDALFGDNSVIKKSSFDEHLNSARIKRYLHDVDTISLVFRLADRLKLPETELKSMLSWYLSDADDPESFEEYVTSLEYRIIYRHFEDIDRLFEKFKRYLHSKSWNPIAQLPFIYYYPYLKGRYLLLVGRYKEAEQYLGLAVSFRPTYSGMACSDLVDVYLRLGRDGEALKVIKSMLGSPRDTAEFMYFKTLHHRE
jgi:hypothetical protein